MTATLEVDGGELAVVSIPGAHVSAAVSAEVSTASGDVAVVKSEPAPGATVEAGPSRVVVEAGASLVTVQNSGVLRVVETISSGSGDVVEWSEHAFDSGSSLIRVLSAGQVVSEIRVKVLEVFDGAPTLEVGSAADSDLWLSLDATDLGRLCEYHCEAVTPFSTSESIRLIIVAGGATQGRVGLLHRVIL